MYCLPTYFVRMWGGEAHRTLSAHKLYGTLPWKDVVMPVAELAKGWRVSRELARRLRVGNLFY